MLPCSRVLSRAQSLSLSAKGNIGSDQVSSTRLINRRPSFMPRRHDPGLSVPAKASSTSKEDADQLVHIYTEEDVACVAFP